MRESISKLKKVLASADCILIGAGAGLSAAHGNPLMEIPTALIPYCPDDGAEMTTHLGVDASFVEDAGWRAAAARYQDFLQHTKGRQTLLLELGVGMNTPGIIKYPFWRMAAERMDVTLAEVSLSKTYLPAEIRSRSIVINADIASVLHAIEKSASTALFFSLDRGKDQRPLIEPIVDCQPGIARIVHGVGAYRFTRCDVGV